MFQSLSLSVVQSTFSSGMQRFGTASIPTHTIGLALLKSDWHKAVELILRNRPGEHPDVAAARNAWLVDGDLDKALDMMPKRVVAERCILESFKKMGGDTRNAMGALSTVRLSISSLQGAAFHPGFRYLGTCASCTSTRISPMYGTPSYRRESKCMVQKSR